MSIIEAIDPWPAFDTHRYKRLGAMRSRIILFAILWMACPVSETCAQSPTEIIDRYLATVSNGNRANWQEIRSAFVEYDAYDHLQKGSQQGIPDFSIGAVHPSRLYKIWPDKEKIVTYEDSTFSNVVGSSYFLRDKTVLVFKNMDPIVKAPWADPDMYFEFVPVRLSRVVNDAKSIKLLRTKEFPVDGFTCYEVEIRTKRFSYQVYFNVETFLIEYWNQSKLGDGTITTTKFEDYKKVGPYLIPMTYISSTKGVVNFWLRYKKVEINIDIADDEFELKD
jgi:hypothetical protein